MKLTVSRAIGQTVGENLKAVVAWVNDEARELLRQMREALNMLSRARGTVASLGTGAWTTAWLSEAMPTSACWRITANVVGISSSGAAQQASYLVSATFISVAGAVSQLGGPTTTIAANESAAACDVQFLVDASARTIAVQVRDDATSPMRWTAVVETNEAQPA